jgi:hypothetical protein
VNDLEAACAACEAWERIAGEALERAHKAEDRDRRNSAAVLRYLAWELIAEEDEHSPRYQQIGLLWKKIGGRWAVKSRGQIDAYSRGARLLNHWAEALETGRL